MFANTRRMLEGLHKGLILCGNYRRRRGFAIFSYSLSHWTLEFHGASEGAPEMGTIDVTNAPSPDLAVSDLLGPAYAGKFNESRYQELHELVDATDNGWNAPSHTRNCLTSAGYRKAVELFGDFQVTVPIVSDEGHFLIPPSAGADALDSAVYIAPGRSSEDGKTRPEIDWAVVDEALARALVPFQIDRRTMEARMADLAPRP